MSRKNKHVQLNKDSSKKSPESNPVIPDNNASEISPTPEAVLNPNAYTLDCTLAGIHRHNEKFNTNPANLTIIQTLINRDGARCDPHVLLDIGSLVDEASSIRVAYTRGEKSAFIGCAYVLTDSPHWHIAGGMNDEGVEIAEGDLVYLSESTRKDGTIIHKAGDFILSKVDCGTMRFKVRDVIPHLISRLSSEFINSSGDTANANLIQIRLEAEKAKKLSITRTIHHLKVENKPYQKFMQLLKKSSDSIVELEKKLSEATLTPEDDLSEDDIAEIEAELTKLV